MAGFLSKLFRRNLPAPASEPAPKAATVGRPRNRGMRTMLQAAGTGRLEASWGATPTTMDATIHQQWNTLVARARDVGENNDHGKKFKQLCRDNIAGPNGFTLQALVKDPNGTSDTLASTALEDAFARFSKKGVFDVTGTYSRTSAERMIASTLPTDGEVLVVARYGSDLNEFGFAVQFVDPVLLDPTHYAPLGNGNVIRHGIEFNSNGKPVAYHFRYQTEQMIGYIQGRGTIRVPAENVCHIFLPEAIGQKRGLPWMRTALWRMKMLGGFEDAAVVNARAGAAKMGFFRDEDADPEDMEDIPMDAEPGTFEDIGKREFVAYSPNFPDQAIEPFSKSLLRSIASGLCVSYNNLASDLTSVNFSSIRQGALDEREVWKGLQVFLIETWCDWLYSKWLERALLSGNITVMGKPLKPERLDKYKAVEWQGRRWAWIDPQSEVTANEKAIGLRIKSRSEVIRETSSRDPADVWDEISREEKEMAKAGIDPTLPQLQTPVPVNQTDPNA